MVYTDIIMGFNSTKRRKHSKVGETTVRAYHFRLELNPEEFQLLHGVLDLGCELRNQLCATLEDSRRAAREAKLQGLEPQYLSAFELKKQVAGELLDPKFLKLHSQVRQDLSMRVIEGQQRWFEAIKEGRQHVKPPAALPRKKFRSIAFPQYGTSAKITDGRLSLSKIGDFKVLGWRKMRGKKKSVTLKFKEGHFWAIVMCEVQQADVCKPYADVKDRQETGIDPGIAVVLTDSRGKQYDTPKPLAKAKAKLRHIQKDVSRKFEVRKALHLEHLKEVRAATGSKAPVSEGLTESLRTMPYSNRLKANIVVLAKAHTKVERIRDDSAKKTARKIEKKHSRVAVEEHSLKFMMRNRHLAKAASDVAIGKQKFALKSALGKGRYHKASNRRQEGGNSQTCLCGAAVPKSLSVRTHSCPECGLTAPRDQMSAIIVQHSTFGSTPKLGQYSQVTSSGIESHGLDISKESMPGLGILEYAAKVLETRRGESKGRKNDKDSVKVDPVISESCTTESVSAGFPARALEPSVKRPTRSNRLPKHTTGEAQAASVVVNTMGHAGTPCSWPVDTKDFGNEKRATTRRKVPPKNAQARSRKTASRKHPPSGG